MMRGCLLGISKKALGRLWRSVCAFWFVLMLAFFCGHLRADECLPEQRNPAQVGLVPVAFMEAGVALEGLARAFNYDVVTEPDLRLRLVALPELECASLEQWLDGLLLAAGLNYRLVGTTLVVFRASVPVPSDNEPGQGEAPPLSEVLVTGAYPQEGSLGQRRGQRFGVGAGEGRYLGAATLREWGVRSLSGALEFMPGVTVEDRRYAVIRGLGGGYQSLRVNGAVLPSLSPVGQQVPLDVFPVDLLSDVHVYKTAYANRPGNTTAGLVGIETRGVPQENDLRVALGGGARQGTTGEEVVRGDSGGLDRWGFDTGSRSLPAPLLAAARSPEGLAGLSAAEREVAGESVPRRYGVYRARSGAEQRGSLRGSYYWRGDGRTAGVTGAVGYHARPESRKLNSWVYQRLPGAPDAAEEVPIFAVERSRHQRFEQAVNSSALLSAAYAEGEDRYFGLNLLEFRQSLHYTEQVYGDGRLGGGSGEQWLRNIHHVSEQRLSLAQLFGHYVGSQGLSVDWQFSRARSRYSRPYSVSYRYERAGEGGGYQMQFGPDMAIEWEAIGGEALNAGLELSYRWHWRNWQLDLQGGGEALRERREGYALSYFFRAYGLGGDRELLERPNPDDILTPAYIYGESGEKGFTLAETARFAFNDPRLDGHFYGAEHANNGVFLSLAGEGRGGLEWRLGWREEKDKVTGDFWDVTKGDELVLSSEGESLFSAVLAQQTEAYEAKLSFSQTVAWPQMNELLPLRHEDIDSRVVVIGNPYLEPSAATNWDLAGDYLFDHSLHLEATVFYKDIERAVEGVFDDPVTDRNYAFDSYTYANADNARLQGYELGLHKGAVGVAGGELDVALSYTRLHSTVTRSMGNVASGRLQGQPDYIASAQLGYRKGERHRVMLFYKRVGEALYIVSQSVGVPDVYLQGRADLQLSYTWRYSPDLEIQAGIKNIQNRPYHYTQGGNTFLEHRRGRAFQFGVELRF